MTLITRKRQYIYMNNSLNEVKEWICSERPITICTAIVRKGWTYQGPCQGSLIWPERGHDRGNKDQQGGNFYLPLVACR